MYQEISRNKRNTFLFLAMFSVLIIATIYGLTYIINPEAAYGFAGFALVIALVGSFFSYYYSDQLLLKMSNARPVSQEAEPYLYHTIEGVAIAAGIPTPKAYVIESDVPNAFATGRNPDNSAIAVTRGLIKLMNREELEGVIAHEIAHIENYDILFSTIVIVLAGTLVYLSSFVRRMVFFGGAKNNRGRGKNGNPIFMVVGIIALIFAPMAAKLIQMAISRNREYLADATAARTLGYPLGLASALEKLATYSNPKKAEEAFANEATAGLFIVNPLANNFNSKDFLSTHPPLQKRIETLRNM